MDIRTVPLAGTEAVTLDWLLRPAGMLEAGRDLETAALIAILTDGLAETDELLPEHDGDRRGWWADFDANVIWDAAPIGSRLWLLRREKATEEVRARAEAYLRLALQPFIDLRLATAVDVVATRNAQDRIEAVVTIIRGPQEAVALRFQTLWEADTARRSGDAPPTLPRLPAGLAYVVDDFGRHVSADGHYVTAEIA